MQLVVGSSGSSQAVAGNRGRHRQTEDGFGVGLCEPCSRDCCTGPCNEWFELAVFAFRGHDHHALQHLDGVMLAVYVFNIKQGLLLMRVNEGATLGSWRWLRWPK